MDEQVSGLSRRVARLESFNRIHLVVSSLVFAAVVTVGQLPPIWADKDGPKSFSAQEFVLVDQSGRTTARLAAAPKGGAALTFYDPKGKRTVAFGFSDDANVAGANLYDGNVLAAGNGTLRGGIGIGGPNLPSATFPHGAPGIGMALFQPNGIPVLNASTGLDGTGQAINMNDPNGTLRMNIGFASATDTRQVGLLLFDANENLRTLVDSDQGGGNFDGVLTLAANGTLQSIFGEYDDGTGAFNTLFDGAGTQQAVKYVKADGSVSGDFVYDADGVLRVETYQDPTQTPVQGVRVFNSGSTQVGELP
jgi:hypothetical protein